MTYLNFPIDSDIPVVVDTSFVINLNATGFSDRIIRAMPNPFSVTEDVLRELKDGSNSGHNDYKELQDLIGLGTITLASLGEWGENVYLSLIEGSASRTLGDGEASTIGHAVEIGGIAIIDDKKAEKICRERFPLISVIMTVDLLNCAAVRKDLGREQHKKAIHNALRLARMRIPTEKQKHIVELIGKTLAADCPSLSHKCIGRVSELIR